MQQREGPFSKKEREMMLLSHETRSGLRLTGKDWWAINRMGSSTCILTVKSFVGLVEFVFNNIPDVSVFLSNRICQDPLEGFFGQQRQRGRVNENPSVSQFAENTRALRVINGVCQHVRGNCRGASKRKFPQVDNTPLTKRRKKH